MMNATARSFTIVTSFSVVTRLMSFLFKIYISRALGAEVIGLYQISLSVMMMLFTLTSGISTVLSRKIASSNGDVKKQNSLLTASIILSLALSCAIFAIIFALKGKIGFLFSDERCVTIFVIMLPTLITSTLYAALRSWFWGRKSFLAFSSTEFVDEVAKIILSVVFAGGFVSFVSGAEGMALAMTLSDVVSVALLFVLYFVMGGRLTKPSGFRELATRTIPLSATRIISSLSASLTALVLPELLTKTGLTISQATAEYGRASGMALPLIMAPVMLISSMSVVLIPDVAELSAGGKMDGVKSKLTSALSFSTLVASVFFIVYLALGKHLGILLFGDSKAGEFVSYCSALIFPISIAQVTTPMLNSLGKEKLTFLSTLLGAILTLPCILLLPKFVGVYAMAIGSLVCFGFVSVFNLVALRRLAGKFFDFKKLSKLLAISAPIALIGFFAERLVSPYVGSLVTVLALGALLLFFTFTAFCAFDAFDIAFYVRLIRPRRA